MRARFQMSGSVAGYLPSPAHLRRMMLRIVLAAFGVVELLFPRQVIDSMMDVTTTPESTYEFESWVYKLARVEGLAFVLIALRWSKRRAEGR